MLEISFYFSVNRKDKLHFLILFWKVLLFGWKKKTRNLKGNRWLNVCVIFICSGSDLNLFLLSSYRHFNYKQFLFQCWLMNWCNNFCLISFHFHFAMWMTLFRAYKCWCISSLCIYFVRVTMCWPFSDYVTFQRNRKEIVLIGSRSAWKYFHWRIFKYFYMLGYHKCSTHFY